MEKFLRLKFLLGLTIKLYKFYAYSLIFFSRFNPIKTPLTDSTSKAQNNGRVTCMKDSYLYGQSKQFIFIEYTLFLLFLSIFFPYSFLNKADWNDSANHIKIGFRADIKVPVNGDIYRDGIRAPNSELFLFGVLEYDFQEQVVGGKLGMRGIWRRAFFIPFLGIGNIFLG